MNTVHDEPVFDPLAMVRRRYWSLILPLVAGVLAGVLLVLFLPREYVASATLAVTTPSVSGDLAKSTPQDMSDRIRAISQEFLSLPVVEQVAREEGLLKEDANADEVIAGIRARTTVSLPVKTLVAGRGEPDAYVVSYTGATAHEAQRVTNRLLKVFIQRDSNQRQTRAKETASFLGEQLRDSERRMTEAETRLRKAKESHSGLLPEQALSNLQAMSDLRQRAESNADTLRSERDRLAVIEQQLAAVRHEASADTRSEDEIKAADRVTTVERQLSTARQLYTSAHPEIARLQVELQNARADEAQARTRAASGTRAPQKADQTIAQLAAERERLRVRIRDLQLVEGRLPGEIASYQARVDQAPIIEQQLAPLGQDYEVEKAQHQRLAERYQAALISENLETRGAGGQFAVLYPAPLPTTPSRPNVARVFAFAVFAGALLGAVLAFTREYLDKTVHDARTLQHEYDQVVLVEIPHLRRKRA